MLLQSDHQHEAKAASESASFFAEGIIATASHAKEVQASPASDVMDFCLEVHADCRTGIPLRASHFSFSCHRAALQGAWTFCARKTCFCNSSMPMTAIMMQKVASAMGLSDKKPISDGEDMGPAGHMQGRSEFFATLEGFNNTFQRAR